MLFAYFAFLRTLSFAVANDYDTAVVLFVTFPDPRDAVG
jgi:hypothetical protein